MYVTKLLSKTNNYIDVADKKTNVNLLKSAYDYIIHLLYIWNTHSSGTCDPYIQSPELITKQISIANIKCDVTHLRDQIFSLHDVTQVEHARS